MKAGAKPIAAETFSAASAIIGSEAIIDNFGSFWQRSHYRQRSKDEWLEKRSNFFLDPDQHQNYPAKNIGKDTGKFAKKAIKNKSCATMDIYAILTKFL